MTTPRSVRFDATVLERLTSYSGRHPGTSVSATAARLVDEGLRMDEHPGVLFRDGPSGRRAVLVGGPDVWEVIREIRSTREADPSLPEPTLLQRVVENSGLSLPQVRTALAYRAAYPDEVDAFVDDAERAEAEGLAAYEGNRTLMTS
ncbi:MAG: hypothetical protein ACR2HA_06805 [Nocardioides sp.]